MSCCFIDKEMIYLLNEKCLVKKYGFVEGV